MESNRTLSPPAQELSTVPKNAVVARMAQYKDVISLGRGDPDLPTPDHIIAAGQGALAEGGTHYTSISGISELRHAITSKLAVENGVTVDPDSGIIITCGCQEAIMLACLACLALAMRCLSGTLATLPTTLRFGLQERHWYLWPAALRSLSGGCQRISLQLITERTRGLVLVSPDNPTGNMTTTEDLQAITDLAHRHNLIVISDEIYEKVTYGGHTHHSIAALPSMAERTVVINGFSKSYCMTGWRAGYLAGPPEWVQGMYPLKHSLTISSSTASQYAALAALTGPQEPIRQILDTFDERRQILTAAFRDAGLSCPDIHGGCFLFVDVRSAGMTSVAFAHTLLEEGRILVYPGEQFGASGEGWLRVSLFAPTERVREAADRIRTAVAAMTAVK